MISFFSGIESGFRPHDALIFGDQLTVEVRSLLPVPASVSFWFHDPIFRLQDRFSRQQLEILVAERAETIPVVRDNLLIIPTGDAMQTKLDIVVHGVDPPLLQKMASEWLLELQAKIKERFFFIRQIYTDPVTGLYNQRALDCLLAGETCWNSLFLIAAVPRKRTIARNFQKVVQLGSLLETVIGEPCFFFGQGIFGCVSRKSGRGAVLDFSHRLISRLRREKLHRVHVGCSMLTGDQAPEETFHDCWLALLEAERRGPYSLCDAAFLHKREQHPLSLPSARIMRKLQRKWRGLKQFGLVLILFSDEPGLRKLASLLPAESHCIAMAAGQQFVLFPGHTAARTARLVQELAGTIENSCGQRPSMGFSHWPSAGASRVDCVRNCRKAILHSSFYGSGAVVGFDALSLNVSGDLYFDEGDYKQAIREYRAGLKMQPGDINLLNSLGVALAEVNRHREAIDCFAEVLAREPENHMALVNKGMSCRMIGRNNEAMACFERGLQSLDHSDQASLDLYLQLSRLYCINEQYDQAVILLNSWRQTKGEPEEFMFFRLMGEACLGSGRNRDGIDALQRSLQLHPRNADSLSMLGLLYVLEGEGAEVGLSLCDRAVAMDETEADHLYRQASALFFLDRLDEALAAVRTALAIRRNHDRAVLLRGMIYARLGMPGKARQSFQRVITMTTAGDSRKKQAQAELAKIVKQQTCTLRGRYDDFKVQEAGQA